MPLQADQVEELARRVPDTSPRFRDALQKLVLLAEKHGQRTWGIYWDAMRYSLSIMNLIQMGASEALHKKTVQLAYQAAPKTENCTTVNELLKTVELETDVSLRTADKWLCRRNPLYEPGGSTLEERYNRLRGAIECIASFTRTP